MTTPASPLDYANVYLGFSREAVEKADLVSLLIAMLSRIRQLEIDVAELRKLVIQVEE